jgi:DNA-binding MarR family transcriptional regulator
MSAELNGFDELLQHRSRLAACVLLSEVAALSFVRLRELLQESDGNLGAQMRKLEDAGYVKTKKEFLERKPVTWYSLTEKGKKSLRTHLDAMERLIKRAKV